MSVKFYQVGGSVRDKLMGLQPKDFDFAVEAPSYAAMKQAIVDRGGEIFLETEKFLTIRAKVPGLGAADYVLARKDGAYSDGRRPDDVQPGTIHDDLARRDFRMNAIAIDMESGDIIDPFDGHKDIELKLIRCVGLPEIRFQEDGLRILRAFRFGITKNFEIDDRITAYFSDIGGSSLSVLMRNVSEERIRDEISKCFKHDTIKTLEELSHYRPLRDLIFGRSIWLKPTSESR